jgi:DNA-binding response OmpR family regulator
MRILLMEDELAIRSALQRGLTQKGHQVEAVANLAEARAVYPNFQPEALVSDLKLPDGNGLELAAELHIPFVLMTGYGTFDDAVRAMRLGGLDFFTKPVSIKDICKALERVPQKKSGPLVVATDAQGLRVACVQAGGFVSTTWQHATVSWHDSASAQQQFHTLTYLLPTVDMRQITAELLQAAASGTLTINIQGGHWTAWLQAAVNWSEQPDKQQLIDYLARACTWSAAGVIVECVEYSHGSR